MQSALPSNFNTPYTSQLVQRLCAHLGIAFPVSRVRSILADIQSVNVDHEAVHPLDRIGNQLGFRQREMQGSFADLLHTVSDSGPVLLELNGQIEAGEDPRILVLELKSRNKLLIHQAGQDRKVSTGWLKKRLTSVDNNRIQWRLIQPILASDHASRFHYQSGHQGQPLTPFKRFLALLKPEAQDIRTIIVFSLMIGLLSLTTPLAVEAVVNTIAFGRYLQPLVVLCLIVLVFLAFRAGLSVLMSIVMEIIQRKLFVRTVEDLAYRLTRVPLSVWNKYHGPELVNRFFDIVNVQKITSKLFLETLMLGLQTLIGMTVLAFYHPFLLGYDLGLLLMMAAILFLMGRGAVKTATTESQLKYETAAWLQELARHPSMFKFNGGRDFAIHRADELASQYVQHRQRHFRILIRQISFSLATQAIAATTLLALGGYLVIEGQMTLGQLVAAELIVTLILGSFSKLGKDLESFYDLMASVDKLGKLFDLPVEGVDKLQYIGGQGPQSLIMHQTHPQMKAGGGQLELASGSTYALFGGDELERLQMVELLVGQAETKTGHVLLDEFRIDTLNADALQARLGLVRDIELFEGSVDENLRIGRDRAHSGAVLEILNQLGLRKSIDALPEGLNTQLRVSGRPLPAGKSVRLVLARELLTRPGLLIIDGLLDRLGDDDLADLLPRLAAFASQTTLIIATGRRSIARWADQCLDMGEPNWSLKKFTD